MRALVADDYGDIARLHVAELPDPVAGDGDVVVATLACALNPIDLKLLSGELRAFMPTAFPYVPGTDLCGIVTSVGANVRGYAPGDRVGGAIRGALAECVRVDASSPFLAHVPGAVETDVAAAAPLVGCAALDVMRAAGEVRGASVAVIGASGSVGRLVVERSAALGAHVIATASPVDDAAVREAGARETIDHTTLPTLATIRERVSGGVDVLVDLVNVGDALAAGAVAVKRGGRLVSTLFGPQATTVGDGVRLQYVRMGEGPEATGVARVYDLVARGDLHVAIAERHPFDEVRTALQRLREGVSGKIVVTMSAPA